MLLWELSFQKVPYLRFGNDYEKISQHILDEKREDLDFDYKHLTDIQKCFKETISAGNWSYIHIMFVYIYLSIKKKLNTKFIYSLK